MDNASARPTAVAQTSASSAPSPTGARRSKVYKKQRGQFWHLEQDGRRRSSYLITVCGRRLGRWNLQPARPAGSVPDEAICAGCARKVQP